MIATRRKPRSSRYFSVVRICPCLILLDINMPGMDGRETLIRIKQDDRLRHIPAAMFSTSSSTFDQEFAAKWSARFFTKPLVYSEMEKMVDAFVALCTHSMAAAPAERES
jgi:CheY-like chemotaxis protein